MPETILVPSAAALVLLFVWAAGTKAAGYGDWRSLLGRYRLPRGLARVAAPGVPLAELLVAGVIVAVDLRAGAALAVVLLSTFSLAVLRARALQGDRLPCGCFGRATTHDYRWILGRNLVLGLLAAVVLVGGEPSSLIATLNIPARSDLLPAGLVVAGTGALVWVAWAASARLRTREHRP